MYQFNPIYVEAKETNRIIKQGDVLVKTLCSPVTPIDNRSWDDLLTQLRNPSTERPVKKVDATLVDRSRAYHPKTGKWYDKKNDDSQRGREKDSEYTKKSPTTLIPTDGVIELFQPANPEYQANIALMFDVKRCDLNNDKYVFSQTINSHQRWWLKERKLFEWQHKVYRSITLEQLKQRLAKLRSQGIVPEPNEILARLSRKSVIGIAVAKDTFIERLNGIHKLGLLYKTLALYVPIYILTPNSGVKEYSLSDQLLDLKAAKNSQDKRVVTLIKDICPDVINKIKYENKIQVKYQQNSLSKMPRDPLGLIIEGVTGNDHKLNFLCAIGDINGYDRVRQSNYKYLIDNLNKIAYALEIKLPQEKNKNSPDQYAILLAQLEPIFIEKLKTRSFIANNFDIAEQIISHAKAMSRKTIFSITKDFELDHNPQKNQAFLELLKTGIPITFTRYSTKIAEKSEVSWDADYIKSLYCYRWSNLLEKLFLLNEPKMLKTYLKYLPAELPSLLKSLRELSTLRRRHPDYDFYYSKKTIDNCRVACLKALKCEDNYIANYDDKRFLEQYLFKRLDDFENDESRESFAKTWQECSVLSQQRHPLFDKLRLTLFGKPPVLLKDKLINRVDIVLQYNRENTF